MNLGINYVDQYPAFGWQKLQLTKCNATYSITSNIQFVFQDTRFDTAKWHAGPRTYVRAKRESVADNNGSTNEPA